MSSSVTLQRVTPSSCLTHSFLFTVLVTQSQQQSENIKHKILEVGSTFLIRALCQSVIKSPHHLLCPSDRCVQTSLNLITVTHLVAALGGM